MEASYPAPYNFAQAITPSNTVNFTPIANRQCCDAINVGTAGTVTVVLENDQAVTLTCSAGQVMPIKCKRVNSTGTAATGLTALWMV